MFFAALLWPSPKAAVMMSMRGGVCIRFFRENITVDSSIASMDFSAFLPSGMAREGKNRISLRTVDEQSETVSDHMIKLGAYKVKEVIDDTGDEILVLRIDKRENNRDVVKFGRYMSQGRNEKYGDEDDLSLRL